MGRISSSIGLITGIPIEETVNKLIALQARPRDLLTERTKRLELEQTTTQDIQTRLLSLQFTVRRLKLASVFDERKATSSNTAALLVSKTGQPPLGVHQFTPLQNAQAQQVFSSGLPAGTDPVGAGSLSLRFGGFLDSDTDLALLNGGAGVDRGKIRLTDRSGATAEIDLRFAVTVDDVLQAINANEAVQVTAEVHGDRLRLADHSGGGGNLRVEELGGHTTAASLGLSGVNVAANQATGADVLRLFDGVSLSQLNDGHGVRFSAALPDLRITFRDGSDPVEIDFHRLAIEGTHATATTSAANGVNAQLKFSAKTGGSAYDNVAIHFVNDDTVAAGDEIVSYDATNKRLSFRIDEGATTANDIIAALADNETAGALFTAARAPGGNGEGLIGAADAALTSGGGIVEPVPGTNETTLGEILDTINAAAPTRLRAEIAADGDRIVLTDLTVEDTGTFTVEQINGSRAADDLGLSSDPSGPAIVGRRLLAGLQSTLLASLRGGAGLGELGEISLTNRAGQTSQVDLTSAETIDDVVDRINDAVVGVRARLNDARNGILLTDTTGSTAHNLTVESLDATGTADKLGLRVDAAVSNHNTGELGRRTLSETTSLASLHGGAGVAAGSFRIFNSFGVSRTVTLGNDDKTVGDVIDAVNNLGFSVKARVNDTGDGLLLYETAEGTQTVRVEAGAGATAADLRILGAAKTVDLGGQPTQVIDGSTTARIEIDADDRLSDVVAKINAAAPFVQAGSYTDGAAVNPGHLTITSKRSGRVGELLIDASAAGFSLAQTVAAQDARLLIGSAGANVLGSVAASSTDAFDTALEGARLTVGSTVGQAVTVTVEASQSNLTSTVQALVDTYNGLRGALGKATAFDFEKNTGGPLHGDGAALRIESDLAGLLTGRFFAAGEIGSLEALGLSFKKEDGTLVFDSAKLQEKFAADPDAVEEFFTRETTGFVDKFDKLLEQLAGTEASGSLLFQRSRSLERKLQNNRDKIDFFNERLDKSRERLLTHFYKLELAIGKLQNNLTAINSLAPVAPLTIGSLGGQ